MGFKRMTSNQREVYAALRELGEAVVNPGDARSYHHLKRRGLVRFRRGPDGEKIAVLRQTKAERLAEARQEYAAKAWREYLEGGATRAHIHERWGA